MASRSPRIAGRRLTPSSTCSGALRLRAIVLSIVAAVGLAACSQPVRVDGHRQDASPRGEYFTRILVVVVSPRPEQRCTFERLLAAEMRSEISHAMSSCSALPTGAVPQRENIEQVVAERRVDAVLVTSLVSASQQVQEGGTIETRGDYYFKPDAVGWYDWGYYGVTRFYGGPVVYGHFETAPPIKIVEGQVTVLSRLIRTSDVKLVYEAVTSAEELHSRVEALASIAPEIAGALRKDGLIR